MILRKINKPDLLQINLLADSVYPENYFESPESFGSKIEGFPEGCLVAEIEKQIVGYVISFPSVINFVEPLNKFYKPQNEPNCHYIHDLCVNPEFRKKGVANSFLNILFKKFSTDFALVAVMGSSNFWEKFGFVFVQEIDYYNTTAHYMVRKNV